MLKLIPDERPSIREAYKQYEQLKITKLAEDFNQAQANNTFLQGQGVDNFDELRRNLDKHHIAGADIEAIIIEAVNNNSSA